MTHTLTITALPDDTSHDVVFTIGGTHDSACETWTACLVCPPLTGDEDGDGWTSHGVEHLNLGGSRASVQQVGGCGLDYVFEHENYDDFLTAQGLGTFEVQLGYDDYWVLEGLTRITEEAAA